MKAAILCPGPSLEKFPGRDGFDLLIGVNRAATKIAVDVWACGDWPLQQQVYENVIGSPILFTALNSSETILHGFTDAPQRHPCVPWRGEVRIFENIDPGIKSVDWDFFTFNAAIGYAVVAGANQIKAFGADWSGTKDFDGVEAGNTRTIDRWQLERWMFAEMKKELAQRGISLERIT